MTSRPWERQERHYCDVCQAWMGSDRQSILLHESGKKHQERVKRASEQRQKSQRAQEQQAAVIRKTLHAMEAGAGVASPSATTSSSIPKILPSSPTQKQERQKWEAHKQLRLQEHARKRRKDDGDGLDSGDNEKQSVTKRRRIKPGEGHYSRDHGTTATSSIDAPGITSSSTAIQQTIYLEGVTFGDILEEDIPIELWCGPVLATDAERRLPDRAHHWQPALVAAVRRRPNAESWAERKVVDVAYLETPDAEQETLLRGVPLARVRLVLGADERIPDNLEEARLMAMGGEEIVHETASAVVNEDTGLTGWSTVAIKRTTVRQELKEERDRLRQQRRDAIVEEERQKKETEARRMEEAKVANADDSALGAFDVWNRTKDGYKGVDIHSEVKVEADELGKKLSDGMTSASFKKTSFQNKKKKKMNRRTTSADDDD